MINQFKLIWLEIKITCFTETNRSRKQLLSHHQMCWRSFWMILCPILSTHMWCHHCLPPGSLHVLGHLTYSHTMDLLWEEFQWILPLHMKPISFQSKTSVACSFTAAIFIDFCLKKLNVFSQHIGQKTIAYLNSTEQIPRNWNVDQLPVLITSWDIT